MACWVVGSSTKAAMVDREAAPKQTITPRLADSARSNGLASTAVVADVEVAQRCRVRVEVVGERDEQLVPAGERRRADAAVGRGGERADRRRVEGLQAGGLTGRCA
jgi:hypothetical protein